MTTAQETVCDREPWSDRYWLGHCEGFRVQSPAGRIGIVEEVLPDAEAPEALVVRAGLFGTRVLIVPVEDVCELSPRAEEIGLFDAPHVRGSSSLEEWRARRQER